MIAGSPPESEFDAIVVGAGHNGLVAATLLAREGYRVLVLERSMRPGGRVCCCSVSRRVAVWGSRMG